MVGEKQKDNNRTGIFMLLALSLHDFSEFEQTVYENSKKGTRSFFDTCDIYYENSKDLEIHTLLRKYIILLGK